MKKNLLLLLSLVAFGGSVSAMQNKPWNKPEDMEKDILDSYIRCIHKQEEDRALKNWACDALKDTQNASYPEIARCKAKADAEIKQENRCAILGRLLETFSEIKTEMAEKRKLK